MLAVRTRQLAHLLAYPHVAPLPAAGSSPASSSLGLFAKARSMSARLLCDKKRRNVFHLALEFVAEGKIEVRHAFPHISMHAAF